MSLQRRLVLVMLGLLGLSALAGIAAIFTGSDDVIARVALTLVVAAFAVAAAIPLTRSFEQQDKRPVAIAGLGVVVLSFCFALISIWITMISRSVEFTPALFTICFVATAGPGVAAFRLSRTPYGKIAGIAGMVFCALAFVAVSLGLWADRLGLGSIDDQFGETAGILALTCVPVCCALVGERPFERAWKWVGVGAGLIGMSLWLLKQWEYAAFGPGVIVPHMVVAIAAGGANVLVRQLLPGSFVWLRHATLVSLLATAVCGIAGSFMTDGFTQSLESHLIVQLTAAGSLLTVCGALGVMVLVASNRRALITTSATLTDLKSLLVVCPRCSKKQDAAVGLSACGGCGLIFSIRLAEPRCRKCEYTLLDLRQGVCPECGEPITQPE